MSKYELSKLFYRNPISYIGIHPGTKRTFVVS